MDGPSCSVGSFDVAMSKRIHTGNNLTAAFIVIRCPRLSREIGVRMAFGASSGGVTRLILRQGFGLAGVGVLVGLLAAGFGTRLMSSLLIGVRANDPITFLAVAALLTLMVLLACLLPARRASRIEPAHAVRQE